MYTGAGRAAGRTPTYRRGHIKDKPFLCPFSARDKCISEACQVKTFFCSLENGQARLKQSHNYYVQVQGQLAVLKMNWSDFVVWTTVAMTVERIHFDRDFWEQRCYPRFSFFYFGVMLPEVVYPRHTLGLKVIDYRCYL